VRRYVHIGTGNYHASNASNYEDLSLFTADEDIAADVAEIFNAVTGLAQHATFRKLLVGPWYLRDGILQCSSQWKTHASEPRSTRFSTPCLPTRSSRVLGEDGVWHRVQLKTGGRPLSAQQALMTQASKRTKRGSTRENPLVPVPRAA